MSMWAVVWCVIPAIPELLAAIVRPGWGGSRREVGGGVEQWITGIVVAILRVRF